MASRMLAEQLVERALAWAKVDPDPMTAAEVRALVEAQNHVELEERFGAALEFGTAGLRGTLGGGTNRMNRAVVRRTTAGLARYLKATVPEVGQRGVVVGRDGRRLSLEFAQDVAGVLAAEGIPAWVFAGVTPTPVTAFAVAELRAAAGIMVTASHNPPEYNGYKVYWGNGALIIPPHDVGISRAIERIEGAGAVPVMPEALARSKGLWRNVASSLERAYLDAVLALRPTKQVGELSIVYTAMHGVGGRWVLQALSDAGFRRVHPVPQQQEPDGAFPTVRFPNPEEKGAMDLAAALAQQTSSDVVLANDPDADRLAVMARDAAGELRMLSGNEVGLLLGHYLLTQAKVDAPLVITTIVSSAQLKAVAQALGASYDETLTGFKWIANRALEREAQGARPVLGFEEALGYSVGDVVRDKDGIGAALVVADMAAWCRARGTTLLGYLEEIQRAHGLYAGSQVNVTLPGASGAATIKQVMETFRARPVAAFGAWAVAATCDYQLRTRLTGSSSTPLELPASDVLAWELSGGGRVTLRPSGTEPKLKVYFELNEALGVEDAVVAARQRASSRLAELEAAFLSEAHLRGLPT
jgi:phosphomannomutase